MTGGNIMSDMKDKIEEVKDDVQEKADNAKVKLDKTVEDVKEYAHEAEEEVKQTGETAKEKFSEVKEHVKSGFDQTMADVKEVTSDDKNKAVIMHVLSIFFYFLPSLIFYFALGDSSEFLKEEAKNDLNFQLTVLIGCVISIFLIPLFGLGLLTSFALGICVLIFEILALIKAKDGIHYKFPFSLSLIK